MIDLLQPDDFSLLKHLEGEGLFILEVFELNEAHSSESSSAQSSEDLEVLQTPLRLTLLGGFFFVFLY